MKTNKEFYEKLFDFKLDNQSRFDSLLDSKAQLFTESIKIIFTTAYGENLKAQKDIDKAFYNVLTFLMFVSATKSRTDSFLAYKDFLQSKYSSFETHKYVQNINTYDFLDFLDTNINNYKKEQNNS